MIIVYYCKSGDVLKILKSVLDKIVYYCERLKCGGPTLGPIGLENGKQSQKGKKTASFYNVIACGLIRAFKITPESLKD